MATPTTFSPRLRQFPPPPPPLALAGPRSYCRPLPPLDCRPSPLRSPPTHASYPPSPPVAVPFPPPLARSKFFDDFLVGSETAAAIYEDKKPTVLRGDARLAKDFEELGVRQVPRKGAQAGDSRGGRGGRRRRRRHTTPQHRNSRALPIVDTAQDQRPIDMQYPISK
ncbi:unnamed protein product [Urochloa humidicola]